MNIQLSTVKKNLRWIVCAFLGLFHWILLSFPYASLYASDGKNSEDILFSGYAIRNEMFGLLDAAGIPAFFHLLNIILVIVMLLISIYILTKVFLGDLIKKLTKIELPDAIGPAKIKFVCNCCLLVYAVLNILVCIGLIIVCIANTQSFRGATVGVAPGFGTFFSLVLSIGAIIGLKIVEEKFPEFKGGNIKKYVCEACGEASKEGSAFCQKCGGKIVEVAPAPKTTYICDGCGAKSKAGVAFCSKCGGKIVAHVEETYQCENCGASSKAGSAFCTKCGGKIIKK